MVKLTHSLSASAGSSVIKFMPAITSTHTWPNNTVTFTTAEANLTKVLSLTPKSEEGAWKALTMRMVALILQLTLPRRLNPAAVPFSL